jgi:hypothetical protein
VLFSDRNTPEKLRTVQALEKKSGAQQKQGEGTQTVPVGDEVGSQSEELSKQPSSHTKEEAAPEVSKWLDLCAVCLLHPSLLLVYMVICLKADGLETTSDEMR